MYFLVPFSILLTDIIKLSRASPFINAMGVGFPVELIFYSLKISLITAKDDDQIYRLQFRKKYNWSIYNIHDHEIDISWYLARSCKLIMICKGSVFHPKKFWTKFLSIGYLIGPLKWSLHDSLCHISLIIFKSMLRSQWIIDNSMK